MLRTAASHAILALVTLHPPSTVFARSTSQEPAKRPNLLLLVSEDNGPELGCYGDPHARTPVLDALASEGVRFERAFVPYSVCSPSRASLLTGLHPQQNGQIGLATHRYGMLDALPNLASLARTAGYRTGRIGKLHVNPERAFPFDFVRYPGSNFADRKVPEFAAAVGEFLAKGDGPFFLMVNFPDAHFPLIRQQDGLPIDPIEAAEVSPLPWVGANSDRLRRFTADYYNCLARMDHGVGLVLDELERAGAADDTLVVYMGDHGAQFSRGKTSCYDAGLRVPLIVRWPGRARSDQVRDELVSTLDIVPTLCAALGLEMPAGLTGQPLQPLLEDRAAVPWRQYVFAMSTGSAPTLAWLQYSVRGAHYKLIENPQTGAENRSARAYLAQHNAHFAAGTTADEIARASPVVRAAYSTYLDPPALELYDLEHDPYELVNLAEHPEHAATRARLAGELERFRAAIDDPLREPGIQALFLAEEAAALAHPYRREAGFAWSYLDAFRAYREEGSADGLPSFAPEFGHGVHFAAGETIELRGRARPRAALRVGLRGEWVEAVADGDGHWRATLPALSADATPATLILEAGAWSVRRLGVVVAGG